MDIFLLRHGDYKQGTLDEPLSVKGRKQIEEIGAYISGSGISLEGILSSPKPRARESARIVAAATGFPSEKIVETPFLKPSYSAYDILNLAQNSSAGKLLLIGHLPSMAETASLFISGKETPFIKFDTGTLCHIRVDSFHPLKSELIALIQPGMFKRDLHTSL